MTIVEVWRERRFLTNDEELCLVTILVGSCNEPWKSKLIAAIHFHFYSLDREKNYWKQFTLCNEGLYFQELEEGCRAKELKAIRKDILKQVTTHA